MDKLKHVLLLVLGALAAASPHPSFRLPDDVAPLHHTVEFSIDPNLTTFDGEASIDVDLLKASATIWVNGRNLIPRKAHIEIGGRKIPARVESAGGEFLGLHLGTPVGPGRATLSITYQGRIDDHQVLGAYRRKVDGDWYVYTTFTPIEARRVFPCFDEPRFKTPWDVAIRVPPGDQAFSNSREIAQKQGPDGWTTTRFGTTEPLPAEVVAFGVGPFDVYTGESAGHGTPIRVITPKARAADGKAGAEASVDVLPRLEAYTGIPYPFGKLDHLALAESAFGAVENPGLITYIARELLITPGADTNARTSALRFLQAHEIGHQWFGDMVTQASWADVWLSEGFATWISEKVMDQEQEPARKHLHAIAGRERIMKIDESAHTRPVRVEVQTREGSKDVYNRIVYDKGASVLLMLDGWLGEDKVRDAARDYLAAHRFGNASSADWAASLKHASGIDPTAVMHAFLDMTGIPRVSAKLRCDEAPRLEIRTVGPSPVPVCWRTSDGATQCTVMDSPLRDVRLASCPAWTYLNAGGTGYYRTTWTGEQLAALDIDNLTPAERMTLVYDLRAQTAERVAARNVLSKLTADHEAEIASAAKSGLK
jgi:alanyl aminopeptidase